MKQEPVSCRIGRRRRVFRQSRRAGRGYRLRGKDVRIPIPCFRRRHGTDRQTQFLRGSLKTQVPLGCLKSPKRCESGSVIYHPSEFVLCVGEIRAFVVEFRSLHPTGTGSYRSGPTNEEILRPSARKPIGRGIQVENRNVTGITIYCSWLLNQSILTLDTIKKLQI